MNILVADDSKAMRLIVLRTLRQAGFDNHEYTEAVNGADALRILKENPGKFQLVLSDWNMPEMTGIELLAEVKKLDKPVPFGFITSESLDEMKQRAQAEGALFLIVKPFTVDSFKSTLQSIIR